MSFSPATPEKGRRGLPTGNGGRVMPESVRFRQLVAPIEPSPASTYGETAVGESSVPPTPQELEFISKSLFPLALIDHVCETILFPFSVLARRLRKFR